ncbi:hypothetical protein SAMN05421774_101624 [Gemmobacter megaterium]|uniref:Methyltransferase domain-containing protein n=1 Tax=Gemmobacter megaterium TaxID=1086013 RepID=A0A1N7KR79_9RHOB|nr:hypothetical protein [Gemmobacter megaterium]GGE03411.1 hypothetical protein GCM10011345_06090 [Gemmobacter megaterium]SIS64057.1 hypothetical protein SAMN05421774_101624 [Gemmobacter megaterium]
MAKGAAQGRHEARAIPAAQDGAAPAAVQQRPELTLPQAEAALVRATYDQAGVILEYGSGGSTVMAAEMPGKTVFSVESDHGWLTMMEGWFAANPPASTVRMHHGDIGPTGAWGRPADETTFRKWPGYALSVWDRPDFVQPDVVLIDGRFRAACLMTVALRTTRPVTVLFDDYTERKPYHTVETLLPRAGTVGRMVRFEVAPMALPPERLQWLVGLYQRPL